MNNSGLLRNLPAVDEVLRCQQLAAMRQHHPHPWIVQWVREGVEACRQKMINGDHHDSASALQFILAHVLRLGASDAGQTVQRVINATGVVLHTNLGRAPLAAEAVERMAQAVGYANVELDLQTGRRSQRGSRVCRLLASLTGAEDAIVVNNCAAATMLVLQALAQGREVIISRGQLVEIGGGFRLPDVFRSAGVVLREVGTTNRTYLRDYETAISENTGSIIRVHRSNFRLSGFVTEPSIEELTTIQRPDDVSLIDDLGSGCIEDLSSLGLREPTVGASVKAGADLTLFSGDKLFGGPQAGIIVGRSAWIDRLRDSPLVRAMRVDKMTIAALEATTEIHLSGEPLTEIPTLRMLSEPASCARQRCQIVRDLIAPWCDAEVVDCQSPVGGGSIPEATMDSFAVRISGFGADPLARRLRDGSPAIQPRVADQSVLLDLRTVSDNEVDLLARRVGDAVRHESRGTTAPPPSQTDRT